MTTSIELRLDQRPVSIEDVIDVALQNRRLVLCRDESFVAPIRAGRQALESLRNAEEVVYGVTTGVGDSCIRPVPADQSDHFARNLMRFHGCGFGAYLDEEISRAVLVVRLASLRSGCSAVRFELLEMLADMLDRGIIPRIPEEGSVGASGDLTPLSYVAAAVMGEREVYFRGSVRNAADVFAELSMSPLLLRAKEALAIMNGTAVMTAMACFAVRRAQQLVQLGGALTALLVEGLRVNKGHFDERIFAWKPHPGQLAVGCRIGKLIGYSDDYRHGRDERIQATYAIRCAPHIIGVLADALPFIRTFVETEINSVNDNPLIDPDKGDVLHGGNFYGGHIAFAMDSLKTAVANLADLFDRQIALLVNERSNNGLPVNLSGAPPESIAIHHGFKAVHITTSACAAEALKATMPASVFSRSTESHNQDKVSMGTIAARDCLRVLSLTEQTAACTLLAAVQALDLRERQGEVRRDSLHPVLQSLADQVRSVSAMVEEDRALDTELRRLTDMIRSGAIGGRAD
jgi:histidine ammonia-lyase